MPARGNPNATRKVKTRVVKKSLPSALSSEGEESFTDVLLDVVNAATFKPGAGQILEPLAPESPLLGKEFLKGKVIMHRWDGEFGGWFKAKVTSLIKSGDKRASGKCDTTPCPATPQKARRTR